MKNKFKKVVLPLLCLSIGSLVSCNTKGDSKVTVTFYTNLYKDNDVAWMENVVKEFEEKNQNITIDRQKSGTYSAINDSIKQLINTPKNLPSMAVVYPDYVYDYMNTNEEAVLDISSYIDDSENGFGKNNGETETDTLKSDFIESYLKEGQNYAKEGTYSMPFIKTTEVMYYNDDVFTSKGYNVPSTWEEMIDLAREMRKDYPSLFTLERKGNSGIGAVAPIGYDSYENMIISLCEMKGVPYADNVDINNDGTLTKDEAVLFNNAQFHNLLVELKSYYDEGLITIDPTLIFAEPDDHWINEPFVGNEEANIPLSSFIVLNSTTGASWCATDSFIPSVTGMPSVSNNEKAKVISQGGSICFFDKGDETNLAAWKFYKFMTNTKNSADFAASYGASPLRISSFSESSITEIISKKDKSNVKTNDGDTSDATSYMTANIYDIYSEYGGNSQQFIMPVSQFSSTTRTVLGNLVLETFKLKTSGAQLIRDVVRLVEEAYNNI